MPVIALSQRIAAPIERVFDLARSIDLHLASAAATGERAIAGTTTGLIGPDGWVTWRARHLLVRQTLTSRITAYERPHRFEDRMVAGIFARFIHEHRFRVVDGGTLMSDRLEYEAPYGPLGRLACGLVVDRHLRRFLTRRNEIIARTAESGAWRDYLPG